MCVIASYVNLTLHNHRGTPPKANPCLRAFTAAWLLHNGLLGTDTITQATILTNSSRPSVEAALTILKSEDEQLVSEVLAGNISLGRAAKRVKRRAALVASFRSARPEDLAALGQTVGVAKVFDAVCAPTL